MAYPGNLTSSQFRLLQWLDNHGGKAVSTGVRIQAIETGDYTHASCAISFLNLVLKGAVQGNKDGQLEITEYGKRILSPFPINPNTEAK
jgi:hypothetical protein